MLEATADQSNLIKTKDHADNGLQQRLDFHVSWNHRFCLRATLVWLALAGLMIGLALARAPFAQRKDLGDGLLRRFVTWFDPLSENTFYAWQSGVMLWTCAFLLIVIAAMNRTVRRSGTWRWVALAAVFAILSADEILSFHERMANPARNYIGAEGIFFKTWVYPAMVILAVLGLFFWPFLRRMNPTVRRFCLIAATMYIGGALVLEMIGGLFHVDANAFANKTAYIAINYTEEILEMLGIVVFLHALHLQIASLYHQLHADPASKQREDKVPLRTDAAA